MIALRRSCSWQATEPRFVTGSTIHLDGGNWAAGGLEDPGRWRLRALIRRAEATAIERRIRCTGSSRICERRKGSARK